LFVPCVALSVTSAALAGGALPAGGQVAAGSVAIGGGNNGLLIRQSSDKAIINWSSFSIGAGSAVSFENGSGATLNRVTGGSVSLLHGQLSATGTVYLINPNGIIIGKDGVVRVGGSFVASTLDVSDANFLAGGDLSFAGSSTAAVINYGRVGALGGDVALIASRVENYGSIGAPKGTVGLIAGYEVLMRDATLADGKFLVKVGGSDTRVVNAGAIRAAEVELRANGGNVLALAGNTGGEIVATGIAKKGGR
jgi:filamentous hemagglutinin family protein